MPLEGYMTDAKSRLVPLAQVKDEDILKDQLVRELTAKARQLQADLRKFKTEAMGDVRTLVEAVAEKYGVKLGGTKGNTTLLSFDGTLKIQVAVAEHLIFDEKLSAAKALIDECLKDWTEGGREEVRTLINDAFDVDREGRVNTGRILSLRKLNITDERWKRAMEAISDSLSVVGTKTYIRFYERETPESQWKTISLDMAAL
jgi:hypothetical protein